MKETDMLYSQNLWLFFVLMLGIILVPGMDMLFVLTNALTGGRRAGLTATSGIMVGGALHTGFGAAGVSALLLWAPSLLTGLVLVGALYLAWIGVTLLRSSLVIEGIGTATRRPLPTVFRQGLLTCILNPKAYLFTLAVYPQFIKPQYGSVALQALAIGAVCALTQLTIYGGLAIAASRSRDAFIGNPGMATAIGRAAGVIFILVAGLTAWHGA